MKHDNNHLEPRPIAAAEAAVEAAAGAATEGYSILTSNHRAYQDRKYMVQQHCPDPIVAHAVLNSSFFTKSSKHLWDTIHSLEPRPIAAIRAAAKPYTPLTLKHRVYQDCKYMFLPSF